MVAGWRGQWHGTLNALLAYLAFTRRTAPFFPLTMLIRRSLLLAARRPACLLVRQRPIHTVPQTDRVGQLSLVSFFT